MTSRRVKKIDEFDSFYVDGSWH